MARDDYLLNIGLSDTRWGTCKGKTADGKPCHHTSIFSNNLCYQHGGQTDRKAQFERAKEKVIRQFARQKKKLDRISKRDLAGSYPTAQGSANRGRKTAPHAKASPSLKLNAPVNGDAPTTAATAGRQALRPKPGSSKPPVTSPAQRQRQAGKKHLQPSLDQDGSPKNKEKLGTKSLSSSAALMQSAENTLHASSGESHKDALPTIGNPIKDNPAKTAQDNPTKTTAAVPEKGQEHRARAGVDSCEQAEIPGYRRGNRSQGAQDWAVVGVTKLGVPLVVVPEWHACSVPRGVDGPHQIAGWQHRTCPPSHLVEPKTHID